MRRLSFGMISASVMLLAGCQMQGAAVPAPSRSDLGGVILQEKPAGAPKAAPGVCWASDVTPMMIETVVEQKMVAAEQRDRAGKLLHPAAFQSVTRQRILQERREIWFRSPCPEAMDLEFVSSLQRALKARGLYLLPLTGQMDGPTRLAVRRFQSERGLESDRLSLEATRELGLSTVELRR